MEDQKHDIAPTWATRGQRLLERALGEIFSPCGDRFSRVVVIVSLSAFIIYGFYLWGVFYSWGNISFDFLDWAEVTGPRYALLQEAALHGQLPLHAANQTALRGVTDRYFSIPDTPFSPQYLLLPFLGMGQYIFLDTMMFYIIGSVGLVLIYRKFRLSPFTFGLLFLLFNFNGHITSQLAVGHSIWTSYFLMPYFVLLVYDLIEKQAASWKWMLGLCLLFVVILMQGYFHLFIFCIFFLASLALFNWRLLKPVLVTGGFVLLVSLPRLLPPALALSGITHPYLGGFGSVTDLIKSMIVLLDPPSAARLLTATFPLNPWEEDFYIGLLGFALLLIAGIGLPLFQDRSRKSMQVQILVPCLILTALSIGNVYGNLLNILRVPPFTGERVTSRMFILPLVFVLVLAVIFLQRTLDRRKLTPGVQILGLGLAYLAFHDLMQHFQSWRIRYLDQLTYLFPKIPFNPAQHTLLNRADPVYIALLSGGAAVALLTFAFLVVMVLRSHPRKI